MRRSSRIFCPRHDPKRNGQTILNILIGIFELVIGRATGFMRFAVSPRNFVRATMILLAVPAILSLLVLANYGTVLSLTTFLLMVCALLAPVLIAHRLARAWDRESWWLRFAIAFMWTRLGMIAIIALLLAAVTVLVALGAPSKTVIGLVQSVLTIYVLWFDWFLVRQGLQVSAGRAVIGVLAMNAVTSMLIFGPVLLQQIMMHDPGGGFN